jgi:hypothetical protein
MIVVTFTLYLGKSHHDHELQLHEGIDELHFRPEAPLLRLELHDHGGFSLIYDENPP